MEWTPKLDWFDFVSEDDSAIGRTSLTFRPVSDGATTCKSAYNPRELRTQGLYFGGLLFWLSRTPSLSLFPGHRARSAVFWSCPRDHQGVNRHCALIFLTNWPRLRTSWLL